MSQFIRKLGVQIGNLYSKITNCKQTPKRVKFACLLIVVLLVPEWLPVVAGAMELISERTRKSDED